MAYFVGIGLKQYLVEDNGTVKMPDGSITTIEALGGAKSEPLPVPAEVVKPEEPQEESESIPDEETMLIREKMDKTNMWQLKDDYPGIWKPGMTKKEFIGQAMERILNGNTEPTHIDDDSN